MTTTENHPPGGPDRQAGVPLGPLAPTPRQPIDTSQPIRPGWMADRQAIASTTARWLHRQAYRTKRGVFWGPAVVGLLVLYSPRGLARLTTKLAAYLYDYDSAAVRHHHAGRQETAEYVKAHNVRKANLRARWLVAGTCALVVIAPALAWTAPYVLSALVGLAVLTWVIKIIPGRSLTEVVVGLAAGVATWWFLPQGLALIPSPPWWVLATTLAVVVLALGWHGRPDRRLVPADASPEAKALEKPTAPLVIAALARTGVQNLNEKTAEEIRVFAPGVARGARGYTLELELPAGITAAAVMDRREEFAAALKRKIGTVWPSKGPNHPGHLRVFIADVPMSEAPQPRWRVAEGKELDIFMPMPQFTDQQGRWVDLVFAYQQLVVGGMPGYGKSFAIRQLACAAAFDPRVRIVTLDGKGNGDLRPLRLVAHGFYEGDEDDDIAEQLKAVREIREEMRRRAKFLKELPYEENPLSKVTSALVDRYPHLAPYLLVVDECQVYTEHEDKKVREEFVRLFTDLVKRGRSAGIVPIFATQKPDAAALPSGIADNCSVRVCFRVNGQRSNDQVLGVEMHKNGVKATQFSTADKGLAYLRGDGDEPQIVRTVHGLDQVKAEELMVAARQIRERRGLLTGYAAGEEAAAEEEQVNFLGDARTAIGSAKAMLLPELLDALGRVNGHWTELDVDALGSMLGAAGVRRATVWSPALKRSGYGVKAEWLDIAATSDEDPDDLSQPA